MLVLTRKKDQTLVIGDHIEITVLDIQGDQIRLGIDAPKSVKVYRKEIYLEIQEENKQAARAGSLSIAVKSGNTANADGSIARDVCGGAGGTEDNGGLDIEPASSVDNNVDGGVDCGTDGGVVHDASGNRDTESANGANENESNSKSTGAGRGARSGSDTDNNNSLEVMQKVKQEPVSDAASNTISEAVTTNTENSSDRKSTQAHSPLPVNKPLTIMGQMLAEKEKHLG